MSRILKTYRSVRLSIVRERAEQPYALSYSGQVVNLVRAVIGSDPREHCVAVYLDTRNRPLAVHTVSVGTVDRALAHPREIFGPALMLSASGVVLAHNHPTGDPSPSAEDKALTERLREVGGLVGVDLIDHIIIGESKHYSFASERVQ